MRNAKSRGRSISAKSRRSRSVCREQSEGRTCRSSQTSRGRRAPEIRRSQSPRRSVMHGIRGAVPPPAGEEGNDMLEPCRTRLRTPSPSKRAERSWRRCRERDCDGVGRIGRLDRARRRHRPGFRRLFRELARGLKHASLAHKNLVKVAVVTEADRMEEAKLSGFDAPAVPVRLFAANDRRAAYDWAAAARRGE